LFHPFAYLCEPASPTLKKHPSQQYACFARVNIIDAMRPFFAFETRGTTVPPPSENS